ncbi:SusD/RagB family nutrient-binding outer membrane lipoprotein [Dyadobacter subterraneus]|uniref:SusD/RagB family nutrient-binding outer membrane lipoprotein n=1 Tax=Dyadobacter subterraneus TaxID=2773304 RepID=A0ABR9WBR7_9BACT|nr:SusD/RagB family nutrient-binding outer membrane lipoprotein [Dyadobacter subterraneus]MBE9462926.1 SusD/RagB family nutrient-binding outer membrane lipoprotein [Dyadobacter subterraneus]
MKKIVLLRFLPLLALILLGSCEGNFDELNLNSNKPTTVPPSLLLTGILNDLYDAPAGDYEKWDQYFLINYDYYGNNQYVFGQGQDKYSTLKNVIKMEEEAAKLYTTEINPYGALGKFFRAYFFTQMSLQMGDIPMTEALLGGTNLNPVYDSQKTVFLQSLKWLDEANTQLGTLVAQSDSRLSGDIYFGNSVAKWQKTVNAYRLRLLIHLSKKESDTDLNIKTQFATIIGDPVKYPLMTSTDDNLQYTYINPTNKYPENPGSFGFNALRENSSATYVGLLTKLMDPRVFVTTEPASAKVSAGTSPTSFSAFLGADPGEDLGIMYVKANAGEYSLINRRHYYETYTGEPSVQIGYPEMCFNIAEAMNRGWATKGALGTAEDYYKAGILASWSSYGIPASGSFTAYFISSGSPGSTAVYNSYPINTPFDTYYAQSSVKYAAGATGLTEILNQRYLALFRHSGLESYYTYRRTGVPAFTTGPGTGNSERIAKRFQYIQTEKTANTANYTAALTSQYAGNDDINGVMWILK